jgi:hypothetical protein
MGMKEYTLHIGLPKTGTTTLQEHFFSRLDLSCVCYNPPIVRDALIESLKLLDFRMLKPTDVDLVKAVVKHQESDIPQRDVLISLENLSQRLGRFDSYHRGKFLKSVFPQANVVLVLRNQPALLRSLYLQLVHQNYLLTPEEVFVPFSRHSFAEQDWWKTRMQIDIKEWNYREAIDHFRSLYGRTFHVHFYENYQDVRDVGKAILDLMNQRIDDKPGLLPKENVSYSSFGARAMLRLAHWRLAFKANKGFASQHMHKLLEESLQARFIFDADDIQEFVNRLRNKKPLTLYTYNRFDRRVSNNINKVEARLKGWRRSRYDLPQPIKHYIEQEARELNATLGEVVDTGRIPEGYL